MLAREGIVGARTPDEIGIVALRAGDAIGDHTVVFGGLGERLELMHRAQSRDVPRARRAAGGPLGGASSPPASTRCATSWVSESVAQACPTPAPDRSADFP